MDDKQSFALFITWTCYGTWLPGDKRGYVSQTRKEQGGFTVKHNTPGTPYDADDVYSRQQAVAEQKHATVWLSKSLAATIVKSLVAACEKRSWRILRAAVMCNHVHVVITECPDDGPTVRRILKGVTQADLSKSHGGPKRWWTENGSDRYLHGDPAIEDSIEYTAQQHGILAEIVNMQITIQPPEQPG